MERTRSAFIVAKTLLKLRETYNKEPFEITDKMFVSVFGFRMSTKFGKSLNSVLQNLNSDVSLIHNTFEANSIILVDKTWIVQAVRDDLLHQALAETMADAEANKLTQEGENNG